MTGGASSPAPPPVADSPESGRPPVTGATPRREGTASGPAGDLLSYTVAGNGPPMVLVHGWNSERSYLAPQFDHFARTRTVLALDWRGHGTSAPARNGRYAVPDLAMDVAAVVAAEGLVRPVVVGHSLGALIALETAARGLAEAAVLLDPAPLVDARGKAFFGRVAENTRTDESGDYRRRFVERLFLPTDTVRRVEIVERAAQTPIAVAVPAAQAIADYDGAGALAATTVPVLMLNAAFLPDLAAITALCPHLVTGQTVGAGHFHQLEVPEQVNAMIERFLALAGV